MRKLLPILVMLLAACGASPAAPSDPTNQAVAGAPSATPLPSAAPARAPEQTPLPEPSAAAAVATPGGAGFNGVPTSVIEDVRTRLAVVLKLQPADLVPVSGTATEWRDSSLGCPAPDQMYMQAITPGYLLTFRAPGDTLHEVHTNDRGNGMVLCTNGKPQAL